MTKKEKDKVTHYDDIEIFGGINLCGVRGTWHGTGDVKKVTCKRCRRKLTYWMRRMGLLK